MAAVLRVVRGAPLDAEAPTGRPIVVLDPSWPTADASRRPSGSRRVLAEAATVGEYLSVDGRTGARQPRRARVTSSPTGRRRSTCSTRCIADLAAFVGLWNESTVRGPAWRFGDIGRRIERALVVLGLVEPASAAARRRSTARRLAIDIGATSSTASALEVLLAANESLVAYRRRHRSDVELGAATDLLLHDVDNPRSFARLACTASPSTSAAIDWTEGAAAVARLGRRSSTATTRSTRIGAADATVEAFGALVVDTWFATPVNPMVVRGRLR